MTNTVGTAPVAPRVRWTDVAVTTRTAPLAPAELAQSLPERVHEGRARGAGQETDAGDVRLRLSWRGARGGECTERERHDEGADDPHAGRRAGRNAQYPFCLSMSASSGRPSRRRLRFSMNVSITRPARRGEP